MHIGHLAILRALSEDSSIGWIYLVVSPKNPLKDDISADTGRDRYRAALKAVGRHPELRVWVDDIELGMEPPHYTIRTLDALKEREKENDFSLVIGADSLADIRRWKDYERILAEYGVIVYPREGFDLQAIKEYLLKENPAYKISLIDAPMVNISSTAIRESLEKGNNMEEWLM